MTEPNDSDSLRRSELVERLAMGAHAAKVTYARRRGYRLPGWVDLDQRERNLARIAVLALFLNERASLVELEAMIP